MNVNADIFTNILATSLNAETVFFVSDVKGVLLNGKIKKEICENEITEGINNNQITGGMIPKLQPRPMWCCDCGGWAVENARPLAATARDVPRRNMRRKKPFSR